MKTAKIPATNQEFPIGKIVCQVATRVAGMVVDIGASHTTGVDRLEQSAIGRLSLPPVRAVRLPPIVDVVWNQWMATRRASVGQGMAQRPVVAPVARSVAEWIRVLR